MPDSSAQRGFTLRARGGPLRSGRDKPSDRPPKRRTRRSDDPTTNRDSRFERRWVELVIDSGCTWHVHNRVDELINLKPCNDVVEDAAGNQATCTRKGDLPLIFRDSRGVEFKFLLRDVRWAPSFPDSLVSVDQLWESARVDCVFRDKRHLEFTLNSTTRGEALTAPFSRRNGLYRWSVAIAKSKRDDDRLPRYFAARKLKEGVHAAGSTSRLSALPADTLASILHIVDSTWGFNI